MTIILRNRAKCTECGDIIESGFRHDYVECSYGWIERIEKLAEHNIEIQHERSEKLSERLKRFLVEGILQNKKPSQWALKRH
jgi:hypothetical protein